MVRLHQAADYWHDLSRTAKAAAIIGALFLIGVISQATNPTPATTSARSDKYLAFHACETYVKNRLKAPATAQFRDPVDNDGDIGWDHHDTTWTITSTVDSENSFGATLRTAFTCTITDQGDSWHLNRLTLN